MPKLSLGPFSLGISFVVVIILVSLGVGGGTSVLMQKLARLFMYLCCLYSYEVRDVAGFYTGWQLVSGVAGWVGVFIGAGWGGDLGSSPGILFFMCLFKCFYVVNVQGTR